MTLDERVLELTEQGWVVAQRGRITAPPQLGRSFADRAAGLNTSLVHSNDHLLETENEWVHLVPKVRFSASK